MAELKIFFTDFWRGFEPQTTPLYLWLSKLYNVRIDPNPDLLICSLFGSEHTKFDCKKLFFTGERLPPSPKLFDYSISFEPSTHRNIQLPLFRIIPEYNEIFRIRTADEALWKKRKEVNFVYSNKKALYRNDFFLRLSKEVPVGSGGRAFNNVGGPVPDKAAFIRDYNFTIAFENAQWPGYTTEKLYEAYVAQTVPIFSGDPLAPAWMNPLSAVLYDTPADFPRALMEIKRGIADFDWYRSRIEQPLLRDNKEPDAWKEETILQFLEGVVSGPRHTERLSNFQVSLETQKMEAWMQWKNINWRERWKLPFAKMSFPVKFFAGQAKSVVKIIVGRGSL